jgi:ATP-binding cassette subfamily B protein
MMQDIYNKKQRIRDFFADSRKGFLLIWNSEKKLTIINFSLFILQAVLPLLSLIVLKNFIDEVIKSPHDLQHSGWSLLLFAGLQLAGVLISQFSDYYLAIQQQLISDHIAEQVLDKAIELDLQYYENPAFYDELHMAQQQSLNKPAQLITAYQGILQNLISVILFSGFMLVAHWSILVLIIILGIPLAISKILHGYRQFRLEKECMPAQRKAADFFRYLTTDTYAKEVRIFSYGKNFISQFLDLRAHIFEKKKQLNYRFLKQSMLIQFFEILVITAIYCIIIISAISGAITVGGLVIYFQVFQRLQTAITGLFQSGINLFQNQLYLREILKYLSAPSIAKNDAHSANVPALSTGISVKGLSFTYPQTQRLVLRNIDMNFKPGQITAIVGENGSGKSTIIKLLCGLYEADKQTIFIEGADINELSQEELRKNIACVFQDFGKYYLTIEDNIAIGNNKKEMVRMELATDKAGLGDKIHSFAGGYKTHLGRTFKNGEQLSGGQWQKVALARGFYKDSNILILDEPTSSLDPIAEHTVFQNLKNEIGNKIIVLITHRLYNLKLADHIYVMENGLVAEHGGFSELLAASGAFANMYEKQGI